MMDPPEDGHLAEFQRLVPQWAIELNQQEQYSPSRVTHAEQVEERSTGPPGWVLGTGQQPSSIKKNSNKEKWH